MAQVFSRLHHKFCQVNWTPFANNCDGVFLVGIMDVALQQRAFKPCSD